MLTLVNTPGGEAPVQLQEVAEPTARADEVIVEVQAFALNRGELALLASRPAGWRPGQDVAGVVVQAAAQGGGPAVGTRVVALVDQAGWSQRAAAPLSRLAALPDSVSFAAAATLPVAGLTALRALRIGGFLLGKPVLITGAAGGVGRFAVQLAARAGARVTGVVGSRERGAGLEQLGVATVATSVDEVAGPFDLVLESAGGASLSAALKQTAPDGTVVVFGNSSREPTTLSFGDFYGRPRARIYGFFVYESGDRPTFGEDLGLLSSLIASGELKPQIGLESSWRDIGGAVAALRDRRVNGKAVFQVD